MKIFSQTINLNKPTEQAITVPLNSNYGIAWKVEADGNDVTEKSSIQVPRIDVAITDDAVLDNGYLKLNDQKSGSEPTTKKFNIKIKTKNVIPAETSYSKSLTSDVLTNIVSQVVSNNSELLNVGDVEVRIDSVTGDSSITNNKFKVGVWYPASLKISSTQYNSATYSNGEYTMLPKWKAATGSTQKDTIQIISSATVVLPIMVNPNSTTIVKYTIRVKKSNDVTTNTILNVIETDQGYFDEGGVPQEATFKKIIVSDSGCGLIEAESIRTYSLNTDYIETEQFGTDIVYISNEGLEVGCIRINQYEGIVVDGNSIGISYGCVNIQNGGFCVSSYDDGSMAEYRADGILIGGLLYTPRMIEVNGQQLFVLGAN